VADTTDTICFVYLLQCVIVELVFVTLLRRMSCLLSC